MNYYNEYDKKAAAWLRELITWGYIAPGVVDERSIKDVRPNDLKGFTQCHFFAGIGVWSYALRRAGWPDRRPVWTGSCPCQPFSNAGRGDGVADERHLWPHFFQLIAQCRPADVLGEQVASKDGLAWLDLVQSDMEGAEYAFGSADLCAAGVGAPHIRQRLFFAAKSLAHTGRVDSQPDRLNLGSPAGGGGGRAWEQRIRADGRPGLVAGSVADAEHHDRAGRVAQPHGWPAVEPDRHGADRSAAHAQRPGLQVRADRDVCGAVGHDEGRQPVESGDGGVRVVVDPASGGCGVVGHALGQRRGRHADGTGQPGVVGHTDDQRLVAVPEHGLRAHDEPDAQPHGGAVGPGPTNGHWAAADWIFCRDGKWRPVSPEPQPLVDGSAEGLGRVRGEVVAQVEEEVNALAMGCQVEPAEAVRNLWAHLRAEAPRLWPTRGLPGLHEAPFLLAFLRQLAEQGWRVAQCVLVSCEEAAAPSLRGVRNDIKPTGAPHQRGLEGQPTGERPDLVPLLSSLLARHAQEAWADTYKTYAEIGFPLTHNGAARVGRLRGYGNAIVADVAEVFIASYLDIEGVIA